jgi:hypothetical protein
MFGIIDYFKSFKREKQIMKNRELLSLYDKQGYHRELLDASKLIWSIFSKDFNEGDEITWLGHDMVFGLLHGQTLIADKEAVEKKNDLSFWKKIDELNFEYKIK